MFCQLKKYLIYINIEISQPQIEKKAEPCDLLTL